MKNTRRAGFKQKPENVIFNFRCHTSVFENGVEQDTFAVRTGVFVQ